MKMPLTHADLLLTIAKGDKGDPGPVEPGMAMYNGFMVATAGGGYITGKTA